MSDFLVFNVLGPLAILSPFILFGALQIVLPYRWRGAWRLAALLPAGAFLVWLVGFGLDVGRDATARNLWPFELVLGAVGASLFLTALIVARWLGRLRRSG